MHGLPQKIGQLLAFSEIESSSPVFTLLTENEPSLSKDEAFSAIETALGKPINEVFSWIHPIGIAASIGQAHRARLLDGREVAIKIQYPGIADAIEYDLKALHWLATPLGSFKSGFDMASFRQEIGETLRAELDYQYEAEALHEFNALLKAAPNSLQEKLELPSVIDFLVRKDLLVTTWQEGYGLSEAKGWEASDRHEISSILVELFMRSLFDWGRIHADPHPGNYRFLKKARNSAVGLIDFGCVKKMDTDLQSGIRRLIKQGVQHQRSQTKVYDAFLEMGFNPDLLHPLKETLPGVAQIVALPFGEKGTFDVADWRLGERLRSVLGSNRMSFRMAGPPSLLFLLRSFQGLVHYLRSLDSPLNWSSIYQNIIEELPLTERKPASQTLDDQPSMLSETLKIRVVDDGSVKVDLSFLAGAVDNLNTLVPTELKPKIEERGIDLKSVSQNAQRSDYAPGPLFSIEEERKSVQVWLE